MIVLKLFMRGEREKRELSKLLSNGTGLDEVCGSSVAKLKAQPHLNLNFQRDVAIPLKKKKNFIHVD